MDPASSNSAKKLVLEYLHPILEEFLQISETWTRRGGDSTQRISTDRMQSLASLCVIAALLIPDLSAVNSSQSRDIETTLFGLVDNIFETVLDPGQDHGLLEIWITCIASYIPKTTTAEIEALHQGNAALLKLFARLSSALQTQRLRQLAEGNVDVMELDDEFESQGSQGNTVSKTSLPRQDIRLNVSPDAFYLGVTQRLRLLSITHEDQGQIGLVPEIFVDELLELDYDDLILSRDVMRELFRSDLVISPDNALRVVETVGKLIGEAEYSCCEVALGICLDVMEGFISIWSNEKEEISAMVGDLYSHIIANCLPKNCLSPKAQIWLSRLLYRLLEVKPSYGATLKLPSCRSSLLSIMQQGTMPVKYSIGIHLPEIFGLYVLKVHDDIFVEILKSLPSDPEAIEGIAFRLLALAGLACQWPTLLRRCIYHIFETPGRLKDCAKFASRCLGKVSQFLSLASPMDLFKLFAPQLLYTWLEHDSIEDMPCDIFGFQTSASFSSKAKVKRLR